MSISKDPVLSSKSTSKSNQKYTQALSAAVELTKSPDCTLSPTARFVLLMLSTYVGWREGSKKAGDEYVVFPGVDRLARETGASASTVKRTLKELEEAGYITRHRRFNTSTITRLICLESGRPTPPMLSDEDIQALPPCVEIPHTSSFGDDSTLDHVDHDSRPPVDNEVIGESPGDEDITKVDTGPPIPKFGRIRTRRERAPVVLTEDELGTMKICEELHGRICPGAIGVSQAQVRMLHDRLTNAGLNDIHQYIRTRLTYFAHRQLEGVSPPRHWGIVLDWLMSSEDIFRWASKNGYVRSDGVETQY